MPITETQVPAAACPCCGDKQDLASALTEQHRPKPGDFSICIVCGYVSRFTDDLGRRELTPEEFDALPGDALLEISRIERARVAVMALCGRGPRP